MARPKQYDDATVRSGLVATFLERGFADTSIVDLEQGSGLNRRQLYNAYGDKKAVFLQALNDFAAMAGGRFLAPLENGSAGMADAEATLMAMTGPIERPEDRFGCLVCNSARETIAADPDISPVIDGFFRRIEGAYRAAIERSVSMGESPASTDAARRARLLLGVHVAVCVLARAGENTEVLKDMVAEALDHPS